MGAWYEIIPTNNGISGLVNTNSFITDINKDKGWMVYYTSDTTIPSNILIAGDKERYVTVAWAVSNPGSYEEDFKGNSHLSNYLRRINTGPFVEQSEDP